MTFDPNALRRAAMTAVFKYFRGGADITRVSAA
jgi:hypothetical protein